MTPQQDNSIFKTALYMRISKEDAEAGESASISTQRDILREYANKHELAVIGEYVDEGFSGTNFERPDFKRMIRDVEAGKINCIITKDLSRLGRNAARTEDLIDQYFPKHGVRYISIIDGLDSYCLTNGMAMAAPMIMSMHEMYARDISNKITSSFKARMREGKYIGNFAPYGYKKDEADNNHLVVDDEAAEVVKEMFAMAADGKPPSAIADFFNSKGILTPAAYRCSTRPDLRLDDYSTRREWTSSIICKMLRNTVYLGQLSQGKTKKVSFKSKETMAVKPEEWIVVNNTHEPIIPEETFRLVRARCVSRQSPPTKGFENVFSGIAKCADCGRNMTPATSRKKEALYNLCCGGYKTYGASECSNHFIDYDLLYDAVLRELKKWVSLTKEDKDAIAKELEREAVERQKQKDPRKRIKLAKAKKRVSEITGLMKKQYEEYALEGSASNTAGIFETLSAAYAVELNELKKSIANIEQQLETDASTARLYRDFFSILDEITDVEVLSKPLLGKLIDRIEIGQGSYIKDANGIKRKQQQIKIYYRFIGCITDDKTAP